MSCNQLIDDANSKLPKLPIIGGSLITPDKINTGSVSPLGRPVIGSGTVPVDPSSKFNSDPIRLNLNKALRDAANNTPNKPTFFEAIGRPMDVQTTDVDITYNPQDQTQSSPESQRQLFEASLPLLRDSYNRIIPYLQKRSEELQKIRSEGRLIEVESEIVDNTGNPIGGIQITRLVIPSELGIDARTIMSIQDPNARVSELQTVMQQSTPLKSPFDDVKAMEENNISASDLINFSKLMKMAQTNTPDNNSFTSAYTKSDQLDISVSSTVSKDQIESSKRLFNGSATTEDIQFLASGNLNRAVAAMQKEVQSLPQSFLDTVVEALDKTATSPTAGILAAETPIAAILANKDKTLLSTLESVKTYQDLLDSEAYLTFVKKSGVEGLPRTLDEMIKFAAEEGYTKNKPENRFVQSMIHKIKEYFGHHNLSHTFHTTWWQGKLFPAAGVIIYGKDAIKYTGKAFKDDTPESDSAALNAVKYGALAALDGALLCGWHPGTWPVLLIAAGIYTGAAYLEPIVKKNAEAQFADARETVAREWAPPNGQRLVPSAFRDGIVIPYSAVYAAVSKMDDDPSNDLILHRYGETKPTTKTVEYTIPIEGYMGEPRSITGSRDIGVPIVPVNIYNAADARFLDPENTASSTTRSTLVCKCCEGGCDDSGIPNYLEGTPSGRPVLRSAECSMALQNIGYGYLQRQFNSGLAVKTETGRVIEQAVLDSTNLFQLGYEILCRKKYPNVFCFTKNTQVLTPTGTVFINELKDGDKIIAFDEFGVLRESFVTKTFIHDAGEVYLYEFENGTRIESTNNHPFYTSKGFIEIGSLNIGDSVIDLSGMEIKLIGITKIQSQPVYNIEVDTYHTYIANNFRVHNKFQPVNPSVLSDIQRIMLGMPPSNPAWYPRSVGVDDFSNPANNWPTTPSNPDLTPNRGSFYWECELQETIDILASPLAPGKTRRSWACHAEWQAPSEYGSIPTISTGPFSSDGTNSGYPNKDSFVGVQPASGVDAIQIPKPPIQNSEEAAGPPYMAIAEPSNPYFPLQSSNIGVYLGGYPFFLNENEIEIVKRGDPTEIQNYFQKKYPEDTDKLVPYHLTLIGNKYKEHMEKEARNSAEKTSQFDCASSKLMTNISTSNV